MQTDAFGHDVVLGTFGSAGRRRLARIAQFVLRGGLVALLVLWGLFKFTAMEAEGIRPLVDHSPLLRWMYSVFSVQDVSNIIGVIELTAAVLIAQRAWAPRASAIGSLVAVGTFLITLSFLFTTPGALAADSPIGGFLMKDLLLLGAALFTAAEALDAAASPARTGGGRARTAA